MRILILCRQQMIKGQQARAPIRKLTENCDPLALALVNFRYEAWYHSQNYYSVRSSFSGV